MFKACQWEAAQSVMILSVQERRIMVTNLQPLSTWSSRGARKTSKHLQEIYHEATGQNSFSITNYKSKLLFNLTLGIRERKDHLNAAMRDSFCCFRSSFSFSRWQIWASFSRPCDYQLICLWTFHPGMTRTKKTTMKSLSALGFCVFTWFLIASSSPSSCSRFLNCSRNSRTFRSTFWMNSS